MKMIVGLVRFIVRSVVTTIGLFIYYMERLADRFVGIARKSEYVRGGRCKRCGTCCKALAIELPRRFARRGWVVWFFRRWHWYRYNFVFIGIDENFLIYECRHLRKDGRCGIHVIRPRLCREYPRLRLYGRPDVYPTCGYYFTKRRQGPSFKEVLGRVKKT